MNTAKLVSGVTRSAVLALALLMGAAGCEQQDAGSLLGAYAAQAPKNRATAVSGMVAAIKAGQIEYAQVLSLAHDRLDAVEPPAGAPPTPSPASNDAVDFAWAALETLAAVEDRLPHEGEFEIMWRKIGRLAYRGAETALLNGRLGDAGSIVLAGPGRWQNDAYWVRYPDHDALTAVILAQSGRRAEALQRLESRPELQGPAKEAYDAIRAMR